MRGTDAEREDALSRAGSFPTHLTHHTDTPALHPHRMHRFFISEEILRSTPLLLPDEVAHQVTRGLRRRSGPRAVRLRGDGAESGAVLEAVSPKEVTARLLETRLPEVALACRLHVAVADPQGETLEWVVQKLTQLGVSRISLPRT